MTKFRLVAGTINHYEAEEGWMNVHLDIAPRPIWHGPLLVAVLPDIVADISDRSEITSSLRGAMFDEIRLHHVLEHVAPSRAGDALANCAWLLRDFGTLDVETPDFLRVARAWLEEELDDPGVEQWVYGEDLGENGTPADSHRSIWTRPKLAGALAAAGFDPGEPIDAGHAVRYRATREKGDTVWP